MRFGKEFEFVRVAAFRFRAEGEFE